MLIPGDIRKGKQKQYYLSNYKYIIDERAKRKKDKDKDILADTAADKDITLQLLQLLSNRKYTYHNIHLETNLCYNDDYGLLEWNIPSSYNKQKVVAFNLELHRKCSITVSPTKTTSISFQCTSRSLPSSYTIRFTRIHWLLWSGLECIAVGSKK